MTLRALDRAEELLTATLLAAMTLLTFIQVVLRDLFESGLVWGLEATVYMFGWLVLLGISGVVRTDGHIAVDILTKHLGPSARKAAALLATGLCLLYTGLMLAASWTLVARLQAFGSLAHDLPLPRWVLLLSLPIGFALLGLRLIQATVGIVRGTRPVSGHGHTPTGLDTERQ
ncbi:MAG TPA: TRAP transporter small permease [Gammaproteobacteria bacterium]|jgi:C4-dicarboxylate transporter DctQ subunit